MWLGRPMVAALARQRAIEARARRSVWQADEGAIAHPIEVTAVEFADQAPAERDENVPMLQRGGEIVPLSGSS